MNQCSKNLNSRIWHDNIATFDMLHWKKHGQHLGSLDLWDALGIEPIAELPNASGGTRQICLSILRTSVKMMVFQENRLTLRKSAISIVRLDYQVYCNIVIYINLQYMHVYTFILAPIGGASSSTYLLFATKCCGRSGSTGLGVVASFLRLGMPGPGPMANQFSRCFWLRWAMKKSPGSSEPELETWSHRWRGLQDSRISGFSGLRYLTFLQRTYLSPKVLVFDSNWYREHAWKVNWFAVMCLKKQIFCAEALGTATSTATPVGQPTKKATWKEWKLWLVGFTTSRQKYAKTSSQHLIFNFI